MRVRDPAVLGLVLALLAGAVATGVEQGRLWPTWPDRDRFPLRGLDVSHHQGPIRWREVVADDVAFVYLKASEGGDWTDPRFAEHWRRTGRLGLPRGAYHFFTFCAPGLAQAEHFLRVAPPEADSLPPAVDVELGGNCGRRPSPAELGRELGAFLARVTAAHGRAPLVYVTPELLELHPWVRRMAGDRLWLRSLWSEPKPPFALWQYHCRARVAGIDGPVDLNVAPARP